MNFKKGKIITILLALVLALSACNSGTSGKDDDNSDNSSDSTSNESNEKVTIVYATGKDTTGATDKVIQAFENKYPNIKVKFRELPNDSGKQHDTYVTQFNAGSSEFDVFDMDVVWGGEFAQAGYTLPLDRFIQQDNLDLSQYNQGALSAGQFKGKQSTLPRFIDVGLLFYRKDLVKEVPKTWEDLISQAKKLQGKNGTKYGYVGQFKQYEGFVCNAAEFLASYGGGFVKDGKVIVNTPESIKGLKKLVEVTTSDFSPSNITTFTEPETETAFIEGNAVFARNWPYLYASASDKSKSKIVGKVGVAPLPAGDVGSASALGGWMTAINKNSKHKEAAWKFLQFVTGPEGEKIFAIEGAKSPTITSLYDDPEVLKANPFFKKEGFQQALKAAVSRPVVANYQKVSSIIQIEGSKAIAGEETAEQAAQKMETQIKAALKQ